jgi:hypothetical protein
MRIAVDIVTRARGGFRGRIHRNHDGPSGSLEDVIRDNAGVHRPPLARGNVDRPEATPTSGGVAGSPLVLAPFSFQARLAAAICLLVGRPGRRGARSHASYAATAALMASGLSAFWSGTLGFGAYCGVVGVFPCRA